MIDFIFYNKLRKNNHIESDKLMVWEVKKKKNPM